jgi:hypothetical protein
MAGVVPDGQKGSVGMIGVTELIAGCPRTQQSHVPIFKQRHQRNRDQQDCQRAKQRSEPPDSACTARRSAGGDLKPCRKRPRRPWRDARTAVLGGRGRRIWGPSIRLKPVADLIGVGKHRVSMASRRAMNRQSQLSALYRPNLTSHKRGNFFPAGQLGWPVFRLTGHSFPRNPLNTSLNRRTGFV